jgi:hypothetical protein
VWFYFGIHIFYKKFFSAFYIAFISIFHIFFPFLGLFSLLHFLFRMVIPDGRYSISPGTLLRDVNAIYSSLGLSYKITGKSAKSLGVSTAFMQGMSDDEIMILGRWRNIATSRHYRLVDDATLYNIYSKLQLPDIVPPYPLATQYPTTNNDSVRTGVLAPSSFYQPLSLPWEGLDCMTSRTAPLCPYPGASGSAVPPPDGSQSAYHLGQPQLLRSGFYWSPAAPLDTTGYPMAAPVPNVYHPGQQQLRVEARHTFFVRFEY